VKLLGGPSGNLGSLSDPAKSAMEGFLIKTLQNGGILGSIAVMIAGVGMILVGVGVVSWWIAAGIAVFGVGLSQFSISFHSKRSADLTVAAAAKGQSDRTALGAALGVAISTVSTDPAINRETDKQARSTPPAGTPTAETK